MLLSKVVSRMRDATEAVVLASRNMAEGAPYEFLLRVKLEPDSWRELILSRWRAAAPLRKWPNTSSGSSRAEQPSKAESVTVTSKGLAKVKQLTPPPAYAHA